ncbi:hypothetical protein HY480_02475 [Candidatus Uhrbacteria bacterium]|nr:hypothetical protein [Candidatus Uhrbacteria bacterium]
MPKRTKELQGVVIAFDGVVVRSHRAIARCVEHAAQRLGIPFRYTDIVHGQPLADAIAALAERHHAPVHAHDRADATTRCLREYTGLLRGRHAALMPGITSVLAGLATADPLCTGFDTEQPVRVAIVSPNACGLRRLVRSLGLTSYCDVVLDGGDVHANGNPPNVFAAAAKTLDVPTRACVGIAATPTGIRTIAAAGLCPIAIRTHLASSDALGFAGAEAIFAGIEHCTPYTLQETLNAGYSRSGGYGPRRRATGTRHAATTG